MTNIPTTSQFKSATTPSGKRAVEAWSAVWLSEEREVAIVAPTLEALKILYEDLTEEALDITLAQHVWIVAFSTLEDAPTSPAPRGASVKCKFCDKQASFIIKKTPVCVDCRGQVT